MDAHQVKEILNKQDIFDLLSSLDGDPKIVGNLIYSRTICHHGQKHKLVYFPDAKQFTCFTDCSCNFDIFSLVGKIYNLDFASSFKYICGKFNILTDNSFYSADQVDTTFIRKFRKKEDQHILEEIPKTLLNSYYNLYHNSWIKDGISMNTMKKFNIMFSIRENKIIIPHFDIDNRLLGIRGRALNQDEIDSGKKYMPVYNHKGGVLKHATGGNLYGVNVNKERIKEVKSVILLESEKGPMQLDSMNFCIPGLGVSGSTLTFEQVKILQKLGIENVILGLDKEWENENEEKFYKHKIVSAFINKLYPYFRISLLWDSNNLLDLKQSPTDKGTEVFNELFQKRIFI